MLAFLLENFVKTKAMKNILVIAVHPDDETLGCGGTLLRHVAEGDAVHWLTITAAKEEQGYAKALIETRAQELKAVHQAYAFESAIHLDFATTRLDEYPMGELVGAVAGVFRQVQPQVLYLQHGGDAHSDHAVTFQAAYSCTKSFRYPYLKEVYAMETLSETEFSAPLVGQAFLPNHFVDISPYLEAKLDIMQLYKSEVGEHPFPRSLRNMRALATLRGAQAGVEYAEAFMCLKYIR